MSRTEATNDCSADEEGKVQRVCVADLALEMRRSVRAYTSAITNSDTPRLVGILAEQPHQAPAERRAAETYSDTIAATLAQDGLAYEICRCSWNADQNHGPEAVEAAIREQNRRSDVHGILVFYPIFPHSHNTATSDAGLLRTSRHYYMNPNTGMRYKSFDDYLRDCVTPSKDVEGLCHNHEALQQPLFRARGGLHLPNNVYIPCTAQAVYKILETYHLPKYYARTKNKQAANTQATTTAAVPQQQRWQGQTVTVINRSSVLGRPLSALLALEGANVYSVDDRSILRFHQSSSSSVVSTAAATNLSAHRVPAAILGDCHGRASRQRFLPRQRRRGGSHDHCRCLVVIVAAPSFVQCGSRPAATAIDDGHSTDFERGEGHGGRTRTESNTTLSAKPNQRGRIKGMTEYCIFRSCSYTVMR